jgi:hypothetical protein
VISNLHQVMHGVAIKKHGSAEDVASVTGLAVPLVSEVLAEAQRKGRVVGADGRFLLSPAGQMILMGEYSRFYDGLRGDTAFIEAYEQFERVNTDLKQLITDWQTLKVGGEKIANDHSDPEYDDGIIGRLGDLHERFEPILDRMIQSQARFGTYKTKLAAALEKAEDGDVAWVSDARIDSYHTVWFEMHEDLLRLLGRQRAE